MGLQAAGRVRFLPRYKPSPHCPHKWSDRPFSPF